MFEKVAESKNESSNRRRFFRKLVGLAALAGIGGASLAGSTRKVYAADGDNLKIGQANSGSGQTALTAWLPGYAAFYVVNTSDSYNSAAILGYSYVDTGTTYGVEGLSGSIWGTGVRGVASASTGTTYGVYGESSSINGTGVYGLSYGSSGISLMGKAGNAGAKPLVAQGIGGQTANLQEWQDSGGIALSVVDSAGNIGSGIAAPEARVHGNNANGFGVKGSSNNASYIGVLGINLPGIGVQGSGATGVEGHSGTGIGVKAVADSASAKPLVAKGYAGQTANLQEWQNDAGTALSVINNTGYLGAGTVTPTAPIHGVSTGSRGVYGKVTASTGDTYGVFGESVSISGRGVYGLASTWSGTSEGVRGESASTSGTGVLGYAGSTAVTIKVWLVSQTPQAA